MSQRDLNRNIAKVTGETVAEIARRGFGVLESVGESSPESDCRNDRDAVPDSPTVRADEPPILWPIQGESV